MKRLIVLAAILLIAVAAFAQLQVGGTAMFNYPILADGATDSIDVSNFTFGADARFKILLFQVSGLALYTPGSTETLTPPIIDLFVDGGVAFDIAMIRLGLGAGPNLRFAVGGDNDDPMGYGLNVKATADVMLGRLSVGLTYLNSFELDLSQAGDLLNQDYSKGLLGVSVLVGL